MSIVSMSLKLHQRSPETFAMLEVAGSFTKMAWLVAQKRLQRSPIQTAKERASKVHWTARKYATNLADWIEENVAAIHASEFSIHNDVGYAGQSDALIDYKRSGNLCILDFKTSGSSKPKPDAWLDDYRLQLSAYAWGLERMTGDQSRKCLNSYCKRERLTGG